MTFALSAGSLGSWASAETTAKSNAADTTAAVMIAIRHEWFTWKSPFFCCSGASTVLWTRGHHFPVRQGHDSQKAGARTVSGATGFSGNGFAEGRFDIALINVASAEEAWGRPFQRPGLHLIAGSFRID